ncbi:MAG: hypothetical protein KIS77_00370 [Saprospiraceae bacterium]|nr:hypothetical protein [Saprospiraceae bacterium]
MWIYDETGTAPNCSDEESFTVTINLTPSITNPGPQTACDSYTLPTITGSNLVNPKYYDDSQANGGQEIVAPITATTTVWIYDETGTAPNCFDEESFTVTINLTPSITNPARRRRATVTLPTITGSNLVNEVLRRQPGERRPGNSWPHHGHDDGVDIRRDRHRAELL